MYINNNYINIENEQIDINKFQNYFEESEFISNLMLNPQKYRDFKRNINRINNIDNQINYLKSLEKNNTVDFVDNIIITEEEYEKALKDEIIIFENLNEERLNDLLSHKKLLSHERHLLSIMSYFLGYESFDWNMFQKILNLYEFKIKMQNINYNKIKKRRINILLGQLCRSDKINKFLNINDFSDSGFEFIYEWVKTQLKIYFFLYQNNKLFRHQKNISSTKSLLNISNNENNNVDINNNINTNNEFKNFVGETSEGDYTKNSTINKNINMIINKSQSIDNADSNIFKNSTNLETNYNSNNNKNNISNFTNNNKSNKSDAINSKNDNFMKRNNSINANMREYINYKNNKLNQKNKSTVLITSLPYIINEHTDTTKTQEQSTAFRSFRSLNNLSKKNYFKEARKVNFKFKGFNKEKEKILKEIRTAEMLPLIKNKTFPQMRSYYEEKIPFSKKVEQRMKMDIDSFSLNGTRDENKLLNLIASNKMKAFNLESLFKLKNILKY